MGEACEHFIRLIRNGNYYEAHEVLEAVWYPNRFEKDDEVLLIKGFINASVAFELVKRGRMEPARKAWGVYLKYRPLMERTDAGRKPLYHAVDNVLEATYEQLFRA